MSWPKLYALALLAALTLLSPVVETLMTGRIQPYGGYDIVSTLLALVPIFWWYHVDKAELGFRAGPLQNAGVAALALVALPVYFIRSRGWKRGAIATLWALGVLASLYFLEELGELIGGLIA